MKNTTGQRSLRFLTIITKLELGGAQQVALNTLAMLDAEHYTKYLISGQGGWLDQQASTMPGVQSFFWKSLKHPIRPLCDMITFFRLIQFMKKHHIQIVHTHSSKAGILGRLAAHWAKVPVVIHTVHGWPFHPYQKPWIQRLYIFLEKLAAAKTSVLIAVSEATRKKGLAHGIGQDEQYHVVHPGSDLSGFIPATAQARENIRLAFDFSKNALVVGMVACLKPQKAPLDFVTAAHKVNQVIPEARFLLIGDGIERSAVEQAVRKLGLEKIFVLAGWRDDVEKLMPAFDILALTSLWEGLPCVLGQAMSSRVPIVATDVEGSREAVVHEKNGLLVSPGKPLQAAEAFIRLLNDKSLREKMGAEGQQESEKFRLSFMVNKLDKLYQDMIKKPQASSMDMR